MYEVVFFDHKKGNVHRSVNATPTRALVPIARKYVEEHFPQVDVAQLNQLGETEVRKIFRFCRPTDEMVEDPKVFGEDINDVVVLLLMDSTAECPMTPAGYVRPVIG